MNHKRANHDLPGTSGQQTSGVTADEGLHRMMQTSVTSPEDQTIVLGGDSAEGHAHKDRHPATENATQKVEKTFVITPEHLVDLARQMADDGKATTEKQQPPAQVIPPQATPPDQTPAPRKSDQYGVPSSKTDIPDMSREKPAKTAPADPADDAFSKPLVKVEREEPRIQYEGPVFLPPPKKRQGKRWIKILFLIIVVGFVCSTIAYLSPLTEDLTGIEGWAVEKKLHLLIETVQKRISGESSSEKSASLPTDDPDQRDEPERKSTKRIIQLLADAQAGLDAKNPEIALKKIEEAENLGNADFQNQINALKEKTRQVTIEIQQKEKEKEAEGLLSEAIGLLEKNKLVDAEQKIHQLESLDMGVFDDDVAELKERIRVMRKKSAAVTQQQKRDETIRKLLEDARTFLSKGNTDMARRQIERAEFLKSPKYAKQIQQLKEEIENPKKQVVTQIKPQDSEKRARQLIRQIEYLIENNRLDEAQKKLVEAEMLGVASITRDIERLIEKIRTRRQDQKDK